MMDMEDYLHVGLLMGLMSLAILLIWLLRRSSEAIQYVEHGRIPPGSFGLPLLGESLQFIASYRSQDPDSFIKDRRSRYGRLFKTHLFGKPTIISLDPEVNRFILNSDGRLFSPDYPKSLNELWGKWAILRLEGAPHKRVHGLIGTILKSSEFKDHMTNHIEAYVKHAMANWSGRLVYVEEEAKKISFNVTAKALLSLNPGSETESLRSEFHKFIAGVVSLPIKVSGTTFCASLQARKRMVNMIKKIVDDRQISCLRGDSCGLINGPPQDVLEVLMEERNAHGDIFPTELITDNILSFFFPSEDSVAMLMTLAVKYLTECPKALQELREENLKLLESNREEKLTWSHYLSQLPFTQNVLSETLRLGNIVKGVIRKALADVPIKDFVVPKGWAVFPFFRGVHLDDNLYPDAQTFNPWRWQEKVAGVHFTPFGCGPRYCTGIDLARLEAVVFLHHLVTRFRWEARDTDEVSNFPFVKLARKLPLRMEELGRN